MRWRNCRKFSLASVASSSGWPNSTTCSSLRCSVSRLVSSRRASSVAGGSACASSINSTVLLPWPASSISRRCSAVSNP